MGPAEVQLDTVVVVVDLMVVLLDTERLGAAAGEVDQLALAWADTVLADTAGASVAAEAQGTMLEEHTATAGPAHLLALALRIVKSGVVHSAAAHTPVVSGGGSQYLLAQQHRGPPEQELDGIRQNERAAS